MNLPVMRNSYTFKILLCGIIIKLFRIKKNGIPIFKHRIIIKRKLGKLPAIVKYSFHIFSIRRKIKMWK